MKTNKLTTILLSSLLLAFMACSKETFMEVPVAEPVTFQASYEDTEETRTQMSGLNVVWNQGDKVGLWDGSYLDELTAQESGATTSFDGSYYVSTTSNGHPKLPSGNYALTDTYYLCYPMPSAYSGGLFTVEIPVKQALTANSFAPGANIATASAVPGNWNLTFSNVTSYAKITVDSNLSSLKRVALQADGISGTVKVDPAKKAISGSGDNNRVELKGTPKAGGKYYLTLRPGTYNIQLLGATSNGYIDKSVKLTFKKGQARWVAKVTSSMVTKVGGTFLNVDGEYKPAEGSVHKFKGVNPIGTFPFRIETLSGEMKSFWVDGNNLSYANKVASFNHIFIEDAGNGRSYIYGTVDGSDYRYYLYSTYVNLQILRVAPAHYNDWNYFFTDGNHMYQWEWYLFEQ